MRITLYKSIFCPRCHLACKYVRELISHEHGIEVEEIDVLVAPRRSWNDGIRMIPALKVDDHVLSALFLSRTNIADFIAKNKH